MRLDVAGDHQRIAAISPAHLLQQRIHFARFGAKCDAKLVLGCGDTQGPDHHCGQRVGEFTFEHGAFARHHAVIFSHLRMQKRREDVGEMHLVRITKITACKIEILRHHAKSDVFRAQDAPHLPQDFFHAHIGTRVTRTIVGCKQQF